MGPVVESVGDIVVGQDVAIGPFLENGSSPMHEHTIEENDTAFAHLHRHLEKRIAFRLFIDGIVVPQPSNSPPS